MGKLLETSFNPDLDKQAQEVIFSNKFKLIFHPSLNFQKYSFKQVLLLKHPGVYLDGKLHIREYL